MLFRLSLRRISRLAVSGDISAITDLAAVFCTGADPGARMRAAAALRALSVPEQQGTLCREALLRDSPELRALVRECRFLPADTAEAAVYRFCAGDLPPGQEPLLASGYAQAPAPVRERVRAAARASGTVPVLARALCGSAPAPESEGWTVDEWDIVIHGLISGRRYGDLWLLAPLAPAPLALTGVRALRDAGWIPGGDDRILWDEITGTLPDAWTYPVPSLRKAPELKPAGQVIQLCFSPDGSLFATGTRDGIVTFRSMAGGVETECAAGEGPVRSLAFSADNSLLAGIGGDGTVHGYRVPDRSAAWSSALPGEGTCLAFSPCSRSLAAGDRTGNFSLIDPGNGRVLSSWQTGTGPATCAAHAGTSAACGFACGTVILVWPGEPDMAIFPGTGSPVRSLSYDESGTRLLVVFGQGNPVLIDVIGKARCRTFPGCAAPVSCSAVPGNGSWFLTGCDDHSIRIQETGKPVPAEVFPLYNRTATCSSATPDGSLLALGFHDGTVRIHRMPGFVLVREFRGHKRTITSCALTPDGTRLGTVSWDGTAVIWRVPEGERVRSFDDHARGIAAIAGPAGGSIATATEDGSARILEAATGALLRTIDLYTPAVRALALSPDGTHLASTGGDASVRLWISRDGSLAGTAKPCSTSHHCCAFLPDGSGLLAGGWDGKIRLLRIPDLAGVREFPGHTSIVTSCAVSGDGSVLATGSNDTTVRLWNLRDGTLSAVLRDAQHGIGAVAISPDGTFLAAGTARGKILLYRLPYGTGAAELPAPASGVTALAFTRDGAFLVSGSVHGSCTLFSLRERSVIRSFHAHTGPVTGITVLPGGETLITAGADGLCRYHPLPALEPLCRAGPGAVPAAAAEEAASTGDERVQWSFIRAMLAARFRNEIGICPVTGTAGMFDIQIAG